MKAILLNLQHPIFKHILFWIGVFSYFLLTVNMDYYTSYKQVMETYVAIVFNQMMVAYTFVYLLIPLFLQKNKRFLFVLLGIFLLMIAFSAYSLFRIHYMDPLYSFSYSPNGLKYAQKGFLERILDSRIFLSKSLLFSTPTIVILMLRFYKNQKNYLKLSEQKKIAELSALKNQLNPHFLFNTLNNLYSLALKKSDKTADVIERLSDLLDYMLYRCDSKYVSLLKEAELIDNYLALEKIRYGDRVNVSFQKSVEENVKIAPLILLTFIENAFKHGVSQEINVATIEISIKQENKSIVFSILNTKPNVSLGESKNKQNIGLKNVQQQLDLLYPNAHQLELNNEANQYQVVLKLEQK